MEYIYDILLDGKCIINSGDLVFDTIEEARADADDYIISELEKEYKRKHSDFEINVYEGVII